MFISGAAGVIGRELLIKLSAYPAISVLAADKKPEPDDLASNIEYRQGDLNYLSAYEVEEFSPTIFIHLAASFERSSENLDFWDDNFSNNTKLSHHLMKIMKEIPSLKRVVFASSYLVYDEGLYQFRDPQTKPVKLIEYAPIRPRNLVGMAKLTHEKDLEFLELFHKDKFSCLSVRIFRGYGCGSRDVVSRWIRNLLNSQEIEVYNPEGYFDYIYAKDSAEGLFRLALQSNLAGAVNLGTGKSRKVSDILAILGEHFPDMKVQLIQSDSLFEASEADVSKLISEIVWKPEYSLESAIKEIIMYEKSNISNSIRDKNLNILITSSSHKSPLIRAMQNAGRDLDQRIEIVAADQDSNVVSRFMSKHFWEMPKAENSNLNQIISYCLEEQIGLIIPTRDGELEFWASHKHYFAEQDIEVLVSSLETIQFCLDKLKFFEFVKEIGSNPITTSTNQESLLATEKLVVKERYGAGSVNIGIGLEHDEASSHGSKLINPIFQPLIVGREISADVWIIPGAYESVVLRYRTLVIRGESQVTRVFRDTDIERNFLHMARKLKIIGPAVIQAIIDDLGVVHVIECNPRIGGASTASIAAGSNAFRKMMQHYLMGQFIGPVGKFEKIREIVQVRSAIDEYMYDIDI